jgi:imidazolonepropionase
MNLNIIHAKQILTLAGPPRARRGLELRDVGVVTDGGIAVRNGNVVWAGPTDNLPDRATQEYDASGKVILPGFVDSHTHAVFAGTRAEEFEWRILGVPYMEILAKGGGILSSVETLRKSPELEVRFAGQFLAHGTTTIEAKSGYGLNLEAETRILEAMRQEKTLEVIPTYLGAHALPPEYRNNRRAFLSQVLDDMNTIQSTHLAEFCDVFVEPGAFMPEEARRILTHARKLGMRLKMHADEFKASGGAELAVELGVVSADHLGAITDSGIQKIAASGVVATLLPATLFMLGEKRYAPARKLIESGAAVALATDFNPGTSPTINMQFVLSLACTQMRMTPAEAISAATINGAAAVSRAERLGSIEGGKQADFAVYDVGDYREIPYFVAVNLCVATFKRGELVYEENRRMRSQLQ